MREIDYTWLWVIVLCIGLAFVGYLGRDSLYGLFAGSERYPFLPSCDSPAAQSDAKRAFDNGPMAKALNLEIVALTNPQTISQTDIAIECKALAILNSSEKSTINYSFTRDDSLPAGQYLIRAVLEQDTSR